MLDAMTKETVAMFERAAAERWPRIRDFYAGRRPFLVWTQAPSQVWKDC
ncbi:unnamed protein product, partial [marine sediment metagenome]